MFPLLKRTGVPVWGKSITAMQHVWPAAAARTKRLRRNRNVRNEYIRIFRRINRPVSISPAHNHTRTRTHGRAPCSPLSPTVLTKHKTFTIRPVGGGSGVFNKVSGRDEISTWRKIISFVKCVWFGSSAYKVFDSRAAGERKKVRARAERH